MLGNTAYCPILYARVAEVKALSQLSSPAKDRLFPIVVWRPWPNARALARTGEKIIQAMGERRFAVDLDRSRQGVPGTPAASEFDHLFDPQDGYARYYEFVGALPNAVPVLRSNPIDLPGQLARIEALDRGVVVRIPFGAAADMVEAARTLVHDTQDVVVVIDAGWSNDLLGRELWASQMVQQMTDIRPEIELIVAGSSFPDTFSRIHGRGDIPVRERQLYASLSRRHNAANLVYGDWGSTRPPAVDAGPMRNVPRIDLPFQSEWICYRQTADEGYPELAQAMMADRSWPAGLTIWGTFMIASTAEGLPGSIRSPGTAAAVRINIHLYTQAFAGAANAPGDIEEPYVDVV
jgi:hypothetical protein